jgi:hypothetical protein
MFHPDYKGSREFTKSINSNGDIVIKVDGYEFIPDIAFMNGHAVCKYCGEIQKWEYYKASK